MKLKHIFTMTLVVLSPMRMFFLLPVFVPDDVDSALVTVLWKPVQPTLTHLCLELVNATALLLSVASWLGWW